jgi:hypothetical protein
MSRLQSIQGKGPFMDGTIQFAAAEYDSALAARTRCVAELERNAKMRQQIDADAAALPAKEALLQSKASEAADLDAERSIASDEAVRAIDAKLKRVRGEEDAAGRDLNQVRARLAALEAKMEASDEAVISAAGALSGEIGFLEAALASAISNELAAALKPAIAVLAKARAIGGAQMNLLVAGAVVPDPAASISLMGEAAFCTNLLHAAPDAQHEEAAGGIREALAPLRATLAAARGLARYLPLGKRPKPYVRRGYTMDGVTRENLAANASAAAAALPTPDAGQARLSHERPSASARRSVDAPPGAHAPGVALERARTFERSRGLQGHDELDASEFIPRVAAARSGGGSEFDPLP